MRVEGCLAAELATSERTNRSSSKKSKRRQKKSPPMPTLVQRLFDTCREVFSDGGAGVVPSPADIERIISVLVRPPGVRLAKVQTDNAFTAPCDISILYPTRGGNMHRFSALTSCAVLDVLGPPYSDDEGRPCTYYNDFPYASFSGNSAMAPGDDGVYAWLQERENVDDFSVVGARYMGPRVVEN